MYLLGDANKIRESVERYLLGGDLVGLKIFSDSISAQIAVLVNSVVSKMGGDVFMQGGDDVLIKVPDQNYSYDILAEICQNFDDVTGCSISFGVSSQLESAYINLRRAKATKAIIVQS